MTIIHSLGRALGAVALARSFHPFGQCQRSQGRRHSPNFSVKASDSKTYSLKQFKGKQAVVIAWFPKAFTGGCTAECDSFGQKGIDKAFTFTMLGNRKFEGESPLEGIRFGEADVAFFTASCDTPETNARYAKELQLDYPILSDSSRKMATAYGVVNAKRKVPMRYTFIIGKDGKILEVDKEKNTAGHGAEVAKKLANYGIPKK